MLFLLFKNHLHNRIWKAQTYVHDIIFDEQFVYNVC